MGTFDDELPSERLSVAPSAGLTEVSPEALGAGIGQAAETMGEVQTKLHHDAVMHANNAAVMDGRNQLSDWENANLHDPKQGLLYQQTGKDAPGAVDGKLSDYQATVSKIASGMSNDQQREAFLRNAQEHGDQVRRQLYDYEHHQVTTYANDQTNAFIANQQTSAAQNYGKPDMVMGSLAAQKQAITEAGQRNGWPQELTDHNVQQAASQTHMLVLNQMLGNGQDRAAKDWFDAHKAELNGQDLDRATAMVKASSTAGEAQRISDDLVLNKDGSVISRDDLLTKLRSDPRLQDDPKLRDEVQTRAEHFLGQKREADAEQERQTFTQAYNLLKDPNNDRGIYDPRVVALKATLPPERQNQLEEFAARGMKPTTNPEQVNALHLWAARDPEGFAAADKSYWMTALPSSDFEWMINKEQEIKKTGKNSDAPGILTREDVVNGALINAGFSIKGNSGMTEVDRNSPGARSMVNDLNNRIVAAETAAKRKLTPKEMQEISDDMVVQNVVQPKGTVWGYNSPKPVYQLSEAERDASSRDLETYAQTNPVQAEQMRSNLESLAGRFGYATDRITQDQYNRAFAQQTIARDRAAAGDRAGAQHAFEQAQKILGERERARPTTPGAPAAPEQRVAGFGYHFGG